MSELTLRTIFITGLLGETEADFFQFMDFVQEMRFEHMGVFAYSEKEAMPSAMSVSHDPPQNSLVAE